jgi:hypothetical protein
MRRAWLIALAAFIAAPCWPAEEPLGRLFFTPAQRAQLEEARRKNIRAEELASEAASKPKAPRARHVTINGLVMRNDGSSMVWVNGRPVDSQTADGLRVSPTTSRESVVLRDAEQGRALRLKVGQRVNLLTGAVEESYETRRAQAHAEEAAREAGSAPTTAQSTPRRPRKRSLPDDEPQASVPAKAQPPAPDAAAGEPGPGMSTMPGATTLPAPAAEAAGSAQ